jgi:hypothetical protein
MEPLCAILHPDYIKINLNYDKHFWMRIYEYEIYNSFLRFARALPEFPDMFQNIREHRLLSVIVKIYSSLVMCPDNRRQLLSVIEDLLVSYCQLLKTTSSSIFILCYIMSHLNGGDMLCNPLHIIFISSSYLSFIKYFP